MDTRPLARDGLRELVNGARAAPTSNNISLRVQILAAGAAGEDISPVSFVRDAKLADRIQDALTASPPLAEVCRRYLVEVVLFFETDDLFAIHGPARDRAEICTGARPGNQST